MNLKEGFIFLSSFYFLWGRDLVGGDMINYHEMVHSGEDLFNVICQISYL